MFMMNLPKFLWGEAVKTASYLINRMPSRVLNYKTPNECLSGSKSFIVPPKVFGFALLYMNSVGKLDPRVVKCIFVGYSPTQKGYRCWRPTEKRFFVSMDVTFHEREPFYPSSIHSPDNIKSQGEVSNNDNVFGRSILIPMIDISQPGDQAEGKQNSSNVELIQSPTIEEVCDTSLPQPIAEQEISNVPSEPVHDVAEGDDDQTTSSQSPPTTRKHNLDTTGERTLNPIATSTTPITEPPIALRKSIRRTDIPARLKDCVGYKHDVAKFITYERCSSSYKGFVASLNCTSIPKKWEDAMRDPKWKVAMLEEMSALEKNKTWELVELPYSNEAVGCKWIYTVKHNPEGKVEQFKARLVAKGYSQTYGIDYEETFTPVAKMNIIRTLISCSSNLGWDLHQLDIKNSFLHGDLREEVYMHIPPGFNTPQTEGKVLRLHRLLYGLKQSPHAWFDRFCRAIILMGV
jgi:hypothetical protein